LLLGWNFLKIITTVRNKKHMCRYVDGQILGVDTDGCLICWDADNGISYNCGETLKEYGEDNLTPDELKVVLN